MKKVCVIGLGYIGLPTAILAARAGLSVVGIEKDQERVKKINECSLSSEEAEIIENLHDVCGTNHFKVVDFYEPADYFVVAVPTPLTAAKKADLSYVSSVALKIAEVIKKGDTVILESTIPVGTTRSIAQVIADESGLSEDDFYIAYCPERVLPGNIFQELKVNDRVIGGANQASVQKAADFYKYFVSADLYLTDAATAEMVKLIENSSRDLNIAFAHQVAAMAQQEGLDPYEVIELANKHPRVSLLKPSCGVGGHCIAVDPYFLIDSFPEHSVLSKTARQVNDNRAHNVLKTIQKETQLWSKKYGKACSVFALGLTYKADVDDLRESPALFIAQQLAQDNTITLSVCDPHVSKDRLGESLQNKVMPLQEGIEQADVIVCLVNHSQFKVFDKKNMDAKKVLDFYGLFYQPRKECIEQEQFYWPASSSKLFKNTISSRCSTNSKPLKEEQL
jgi:UDP-N-acetyl-D-mannosaminuronic acid dehydrogenase